MTLDTLYGNIGKYGLKTQGNSTFKQPKRSRRLSRNVQTLNRLLLNHNQAKFNQFKSRSQKSFDSKSMDQARSLLMSLLGPERKTRVDYGNLNFNQSINSVVQKNNQNFSNNQGNVTTGGNIINGNGNIIADNGSIININKRYGHRCNGGTCCNSRCTTPTRPPVTRPRTPTPPRVITPTPPTTKPTPPTVISPPTTTPTTPVVTNPPPTTTPTPTPTGNNSITPSGNVYISINVSGSKNEINTNLSFSTGLKGQNNQSYIPRDIQLKYNISGSKQTVNTELSYQSSSTSDITIQNNVSGSKNTIDNDFQGKLVDDIQISNNVSGSKNTVDNDFQSSRSDDIHISNNVSGSKNKVDNTINVRSLDDINISNNVSGSKNKVDNTSSNGAANEVNVSSNVSGSKNMVDHELAVHSSTQTHTGQNISGSKNKINYDLTSGTNTSTQAPPPKALSYSTVAANSFLDSQGNLHLSYNISGSKNKVNINVAQDIKKLNINPGQAKVPTPPVTPTPQPPPSPPVVPTPPTPVTPPVTKTAPYQPSNADVFNDSYYKGIDLTQAVRQQYGSQASLELRGDHFYDWKAVVNGQDKGINVDQAVKSQYGSSHDVVATSTHAYDWKAFNFDQPEDYVLPVMIVAQDQIYNTQGVDEGLDNLKGNVEATQEWFEQESGKTFQTLEPIIIASSRTSSQWNALAEQTTQSPQQRYELLNASIEEFESRYGYQGNGNLKIVLSQYTGDSPDVWNGAAALSGYAVVTPRETSVKADLDNLNYRTADAIYAIGHELGHTIGLDHPHGPNKSIMGSTKPPYAELTSTEKQAIQQSDFFV